MENKSFLAVLKKNAMLIVLVLVYLFFLILTGGGIFSPSSFTELINQNAYVYILGAGMLMCMLTGGNIDLSCGAFVCLLGAFGGVFMIVQGMGTGVSILLMLLIGVCYGVILGFLIAYVHIPPWIATLAGYLAFRGLGTSILSSNSATGSLAPFPIDFQSIFYGRVFPTEKGVFNWPCFLFGVLAAAVVALVVFQTRRSRLAKGYE
ncbi:MAG: sugar ABC transporter permease, partial [Clostridia bacterium]|nr:sugar ABC transporter permease [Clostridia bacterium]